MIIVEGPDGGGKTTLARELSQKFGLQMARHGTRSNLPEGDVRARVYDAFGEAVRGHDPVRVHDRLYYSELVYGKVLRQHIRFSLIEQRYIHKLIVAFKPPIIMCIPPLEVVKANVEGGHHIPGVEENIETIWSMYRRISGFLSNLKMSYDYTGEQVSTPMEKIEQRIDKYLQIRRSRTWQ